MSTRTFYPAAKRTIDVLVSALGLIALTPVIALTAVGIRLTLGRPVLFRHPRPGLGEEVFECLKFRTMTNERDAAGNLLPDAQRITPFGAMLRRSSLDELPQLWNVLRGEMSLVGPRPLMICYVPRYSPDQRRRHLVRPGITGWAQVNGRNAIDWQQKLALDTWYVDHSSLSLDLKILFMTFWIVVTAAGVSQAGHVSMEEFLGNTASE